MILQLPFFLDASSGKCIVFEIIVLSIGNKLLKPIEKLRKKLCIQLVKKSPKLNEKTKMKIVKKFQLIKNLLNLIRK